MGVNTSMPGQEGIPSVFSPMARTLADLVYFSRSMVEMEPWEYDHSVHPLAWRGEVEKETRGRDKFRIGVMRTDGIAFFRASFLREGLLLLVAVADISC